MPFDTILLVDAGALTVAESIGSIRRAKQLVAFGDSVTQTPAPFELALDEPDPDAEIEPPDARQVDELHARSALAQLSNLLPTLILTRSYRAGGEDLAELVNRRFYGGMIDSLPWAGTFLGHGSLVLDYVEDGTGMPDATSGAVESVDAEVDRVVDLVIEHAIQRSHESLMVVTASDKHAVRVMQAVLEAMPSHPELAEFVSATAPSRSTCCPIGPRRAQSRDRVVFSLGYGRTPHGAC
jgi:hypothetical protein